MNTFASTQPGLYINSSLLYIIVDVLSDIYTLTDLSCEYGDPEQKVKHVSPLINQMRLTSEAMQEFATLHDYFEFDIAKKYDDDSFIAGMYK